MPETLQEQFNRLSKAAPNSGRGGVPTKQENLQQQFGRISNSTPDNTTPLWDRAVDLARPFAADIGGTAAAGLSLASSGVDGPVGFAAAPFAFGTGYSLVDALMQHLKLNPENGFIADKAGFSPGGLGSTLSNTGEMAATGFGIGKILGGIGYGGKKLIQSAIPTNEFSNLSPAAQDFIAKFKPTTGQITSGLPDSIESTFAQATKLKSMQESAQLGKSEADSLISTITGRKDNSIRTLGKYVQSGFEDFAGSVKNEMDNAINKVQNFAKDNTVTVEQPPEILFRQATPAEIAREQLPGGPGIVQNGLVPVATPVEPISVMGPIHLAESSQVAKDFLKGFDPTERELIGAQLSPKARDTFSIISNPNTLQQTGLNPVGISQAISLRQELADLAMKKDLWSQKVYPDLLKAVDNDIQDSILAWKEGKKALVAYNDAIGAYDLHSAISGSNGTLSGIMNVSHVPFSMIDRLIDSESALGRTLGRGRIEFNGVEIPTQNLRKDLASYQFKRLMEEAYNPTTKLYELDKILKNPESWWLRNSSSDAKKLLFGSDAGENVQKIQDFMSAFDRVQGTTTPNRGLWWMAPAAFTVSSHVLLDALDMSASALPKVGGTFVAARLGFGGLGKLLMSKGVSNLVLKMVQGQPLGVSTKFFGKAMANALTGSTISLVDAQGNETPVEIGAGGKVTPVQ